MCQPSIPRTKQQGARSTQQSGRTPIELPDLLCVLCVCLHPRLEEMDIEEERNRKEGMGDAEKKRQMLERN